MRGIRPPLCRARHNCRFSLNYARMAECRGLAPLARRHALVSTEARFARPVDIPNWCFGATNLWFNPPASLSPDRNRKRPIPIQTKWCPWQDLHLHGRRFELRASALGYTGDAIGAHGRICTDTLRVLSAPSLRWTTWAAGAVPPNGTA